MRLRFRSAAAAARVGYLHSQAFLLEFLVDGMNFASTGRAVKLTWTERSGSEFWRNAKLWIAGSQCWLRYQSTSKPRIGLCSKEVLY